MGVLARVKALDAIVPPLTAEMIGIPLPVEDVQYSRVYGTGVGSGTGYGQAINRNLALFREGLDGSTG
jgi:hypothetical protein